MGCGNSKSTVVEPVDEPSGKSGAGGNSKSELDDLDVDAVHAAGTDAPSGADIVPSPIVTAACQKYEVQDEKGKRGKKKEKSGSGKQGQEADAAERADQSIENFDREAGVSQVLAPMPAVEAGGVDVQLSAGAADHGGSMDLSNSDTYDIPEIEPVANEGTMDVLALMEDAIDVGEIAPVDLG